MKQTKTNNPTASEAGVNKGQKLPANLEALKDQIVKKVEDMANKIDKQEEKKAVYAPKYSIKKASAGSATKHFEFNELTYREVTFEDMLAAQRISGESDGNGFKLAIVAQTCEFDGKKATYEDLQKMRWSDFLELQGLLTSSDWMGSQEQLSYSLGRLGLL